MAQSLLQIVTEAMQGTGITPPTLVVGGDELGLQLLRLINTSGKDLAKYWNWQQLTTEATFTVVDADAQVVVATTWTDLNKIIPDTIFNRTQIAPVKGPLSAQAWQAQKARGAFSGGLFMRIRGGTILLGGANRAAGDLVYFEYLSKNWVINTGGTTTYERFNADTDKPRIDDHALMLDLRWRFRNEKGLEYAEHMRDAQAYVATTFGEDQPMGKLSLVPGGSSSDSGIENVYTKEGNWYQ